MKPKSLMLLGVSGTFGLIAAALLTKAVGGSKSAGPNNKLGQVVVAAKDLEINTVLDKTNCRLEKFPINIIPPHAVRSLEEIENKRITVRINQKSPISKTDLQIKTAAISLPVPPGKVMHSIKTPAEDHHSGLLQPGHLVNVVGIFRATNNRPARARTIVSGARVLAVNAKMSSESASGDKSGGSFKKGDRTVSLAVSPKEVAIISLVEKNGSLRLSILGDEPSKKGEKSESSEVSLSDFEKNSGSNSLLGNLAAQYLKKPSSSSGAGTSSASHVRVHAGGQTRLYQVQDGKLPILIKSTGSGDLEASGSERAGTESDYSNEESLINLNGNDNIAPDTKNLD